MPEENKVVSFEQEIINKNTELFVDITKILGQLLNKGLAKFSFDYSEATISFANSPEVQNAFAKYSPERVQAVTKEVVTITLQLLTNQEAKLLADAQEEGKTNHAISQKKIESIKEQIINKKLQNGYHFYQTCIGNVLEQFVVQQIVKPPTKDYPSISTLLVKLTTKDNFNNSNNQTISFELYEDQLQEIIDVLSQQKKELQNN